MANYRARQIETIRDATAAARNAMRDRQHFEPIVFARAFAEAGGVQLPGSPDDTAGAEGLAHRLLEALAQGRSHVHDDPDLQREIDRARTEARWAAALTDDSVVGFFLSLPEEALETPTAEALSHENRGLGPGVFRKGEIVVLQPECDGAQFYPVSAHEIEC